MVETTTKAVLAIMGTVIFIAGCTSRRSELVNQQCTTKVSKEPLDVHKVLLTPKDGKLIEGATTEWFFHCRPEFKFIVLSTEQLSSKEVKVTLKFTSIVLHLSCPVLIKLPKTPTAKMVEHENAHAEICQRVYVGAEQAAEAAISSIASQQFAGIGSNKEDAAADAVHRAATLASKIYCDRTVFLVNDLSNRFDALTNHGMNEMAPENALSTLFKNYVAGQTKVGS